MYLFIHLRFCELLEISPASGRACSGCRRLLSQSLRNQKILGQGLLQQWKLNGRRYDFPFEVVAGIRGYHLPLALASRPCLSLHGWQKSQLFSKEPTSPSTHTPTLQTSLILPGIASANRYIAVSSPKSKAASPVIVIMLSHPKQKGGGFPVTIIITQLLSPFKNEKEGI